MRAESAGHNFLIEQRAAFAIAADVNSPGVQDYAAILRGSFSGFLFHPGMPFNHQFMEAWREAPILIPALRPVQTPVG